MAGICKATIIGNLGSDPEMRYSPSGSPFTRFSVACNRTFTSGGERREETQWFSVTANGKLAEICSQYLSKGAKVYIEGRLSSRTYEGADGQKRFSLDINANEMQMLDTRPRGDNAQDSGMGMGVEEPNDLDAIPF
ncbi:MAG: single-stranded DNA-binding protein [Chloroflexi bacterium]|nr:single-stranded DNA-binding protein [Chloroflexota bacterium]